jgi:hypothetical protein
MTKINGVEIIQADYIGETPGYGSLSLVGSACDAFFFRRGLSFFFFRS